MTPTCRHITDPQRLQRDGTAHPQRQLAALSPSSVEIDPQTVADRLVFTQQMAARIHYVGVDNPIGSATSWDAFLTGDYSAVLAVYAVEKNTRWQSLIRDCLKELRGERTQPGGLPASEAQLKQSLGTLFGLLGTLVWQIDRLPARLPEEFALVPATRSLIRNQLAGSFRRLIEYYKAAVAGGWIDESNLPADTVFGCTVTRFEEILTQPFSRSWITDSSASFGQYWTGLAPDGTVFKAADAGLTVAQRMYFAANHYFLSSIVNQFSRAYGRIIADSQRQFLQTLTDYNRHQPHMALLLSFLRLLEDARADVNQLSSRHLDLYYNDILRLHPKPANPVKAHVVAQLAKTIPTHRLTKGTAFKAGKRADGSEWLFALTEDVVITQAEVAEVKSVYIGTVADDAADESNPYRFAGRVYAAPVANSADGFGKPLVPPQDSWNPFVHKTYENEVLKSIGPEGKIGFGLASPYLWLQEGNRTIVVTFQADSFPLIPDINQAFTVALTTDKGWMEVAYTVLRSGSSLQFTVVLPGDFPATIPHSVSLHGGNQDWQAPVLSVCLRHRETAYAYPILRSIRLQNVRLQVAVDKVRNLVVQTDAGLVNPAQPFMPFGPQPEKGASLIIGSQEVFQKAGASVTTHFEWKPGGIPAASSNPVRVSLLKAGNWVTERASEPVFDNSVAAITISPEASVFPDYGATQLYDVTSTRGYLRLTLNDSFGHKAYLEQLSRHLITLSQGHLAADKIKDELSAYDSTDCDSAKNTVAEITTIVNGMEPVARPPEPYTPELLSMHLSYSASVLLDLTTESPAQFDHRQLKFLHFYPFGEVEQHRKLLSPHDDAPVSLLPRFSRPNLLDSYFVQQEADGATLPTVFHEGEFYLGLRNVDTPALVSLFIQVEEGSADPLVRKPERHVHWSFLSNNHWISFRPAQVADGTRQLLQSGLIRFQIPDTATNTNTLLPAGLYWLRAAVTSAAEAVAHLMAVRAQGMLVQEVPADGSKSEVPMLAAHTIQKLLDPVSAIRVIEQPYPGFGGRARESETDFRTRVSERLRHKDRGVTVWDYEHLVLEQFPAIYQVKCLPHTQYEPGTPQGIYNELAPGHVTLVTLPRGTAEGDNRPLKLYTPVGLLDEIRDFLRQRISQFAHVHVCNPVYEEVKVETEVRFSGQVDESFYRSLLQDEITRFLSPWAFGDTTPLAFNRRIEPSVLVNFIEERPYVDYLRNFRLLHRPEKNAAFTEPEQIQPERAVSILVSVPASQHQILPISEPSDTLLVESCGCS